MKRTIEVEIRLTPEEMAQEFWNMGSGEQARFFNCLGTISAGAFEMQMAYVSQDCILKECGRKAMAEIGSMSERNEVKL